MIGFHFQNSFSSDRRKRNPKYFAIIMGIQSNDDRQLQWKLNAILGIVKWK